jgi:cobalt/nickel transport protein
MNHPDSARQVRKHIGPTLALTLLSFTTPALAHFQELIPSTEILDQASGSDITLQLSFTHPMEQGPAMPMGKPAGFGVLTGADRQDLRDRLQAIEVDGQRAYQAEFAVRAPGDHVFFIEPAPYWEPAEGVMIVHYTKTVVDAHGGGDGWDRMIGFPVEIQPLTRPYGLWAGNLFTGVVTQYGKPVPFAEVEVEWRNDGSLEPPADAFVTQVLKADSQGVFSYAMPRAGWWGFAALIEGDEPMPNPEGKPVPVEQGALIWVRARDMR